MDMASWLDTTFYNFDYAILNFLHNFAVTTNNLFTPVFKYVTLITEKGLIFLAIAIILMLFKKTRKVGICIFGAVGLGRIITSYILKDSIMRLRPFESVDIFKTFWNYVGSPFEEGFSFPSGHATGCAAAMISIFILCKKKYSWTSFLGILLVGISRNYLMAHYPSDVIAGILVGTISAIVAYLITKLIYYILNKYDNKLFKFILDFDIRKKEQN